MKCEDGIPKFLIVGLGAGLTVGLLVASTGGAEELEPAIMSAIVVGLVSGLGFALWDCNFNLFSCAGSSVKSVFCGIEGWLEHPTFPFFDQE